TAVSRAVGAPRTAAVRYQGGFLKEGQPMKPVISTLMVVACWCATTLLGAGEHAVPRFTLEPLAQTRTLGPFAISPDGTKVASPIAGYYRGFPLIPRFGEENNIRVVSLDTGEIVQVTSGPLPKTNPVFSPSGDRIAFESENDIWIADVASGATKRLTM